MITRRGFALVVLNLIVTIVGSPLAQADCVHEALALVSAEDAAHHSRFLTRGESTTLRIPMTQPCLSVLAIGPLPSTVAIVMRAANGEELREVDQARNSALLTVCTDAEEVFLSVYLGLGTGRVAIAHSIGEEREFSGWTEGSWRHREGPCFSPPQSISPEPLEIGTEAGFSAEQRRAASQREWTEAGWSSAGTPVDGPLDLERGCYAIIADDPSTMLRLSRGEQPALQREGVLEFCVRGHTTARVSSTTPSDRPHLLFRRTFLDPPTGIDPVGWSIAHSEGVLSLITHLHARSRDPWRSSHRLAAGCHRLVVFGGRVTLTMEQPHGPVHGLTTSDWGEFVFCLAAPTDVNLMLVVHSPSANVFVFEGPR